MLGKPEGCKGCPLYGDGKGFVAGRFPTDATVMIVGQNPGGDEEKAGTPFVGKTGQTMERIYLPLSGLSLQEVAVDNAIRCRWVEPGKKVKGNKLPTGKVLDAAIEHCKQHDHIPPSIMLIIAQGAIALRKLGGSQYKLHEWRGHLLPVMEDK